MIAFLPIIATEIVKSTQSPTTVMPSSSIASISVTTDAQLATQHLKRILVIASVSGVCLMIIIVVYICCHYSRPKKDKKDKKVNEMESKSCKTFVVHSDCRGDNQESNTGGAKHAHQVAKSYFPASLGKYDGESDGDAMSFDNVYYVINPNPPPTPNDQSSNSYVEYESQDYEIEDDDDTLVHETDTLTESNSDYHYCQPPPNTSDSAFSDGSVINDFNGLYAPPPSSVSSMSITESHYLHDGRNTRLYSGHSLHEEDNTTYNTYVYLRKI